MKYDDLYCRGNPCYSDARYRNKWREEFWTPWDWITKHRLFKFAIGEACGYIKKAGQRSAHFRLGESSDIYTTIEEALDAVEQDKRIDAECTEYLATIGIKGKKSHKDKVRKDLTELISKYRKLAKSHKGNTEYEKIYVDLSEVVEQYMKKSGLELYKSRGKTTPKRRGKEA